MIGVQLFFDFVQLVVILFGYVFGFDLLVVYVVVGEDWDCYLYVDCVLMEV